jgi:hypothetical protein
MTEKFRPQKMWAVSNYGAVWTVGYTRKEAIAEYEKLSGGVTWAESKDYMQAQKVLVSRRES